MTIQTKLTSGRLSDMAADIVVATVAEAEKDGKTAHGRLQAGDQGSAIDKVLHGLLSDTILRERLTGKIGTTRLIPVQGIGARSVLLVGVGSPQSLTLQDMRIIGAKVGQAAECAHAKTIAAVLSREIINGCGPAARLRAVVEGMHLGTYRFMVYKTDAEANTLKIFEVIAGGNTAAFEKSITTGTIVAKATCMARDWVNTPPCDLTPSVLVDYAREVARKNNLGVTVLTGKALDKEKMRLIQVVGRGSVHAPAFVHLRYKPAKKSRRKIALVGKGITFDTGGVDLKSSSNMLTMKDDMSGAAAVISAMRAIAQLKPNVSVDAYIAAAENSIGSRAYLPSDVVKSRSGKTVEIANTDAEGRLVLADALDYAVERRPDVVVDVATLTGGILVALGEQCTGVFSNCENCAKDILAAAGRAGELMWRLPLLKVYEDGLKSSVADLSSMGKSKASPVTGALFLQKFVKEMPWVHLDIAGSAWVGETTTLAPIGGTGVATRTLVEFCVG